MSRLGDIWRRVRGGASGERLLFVTDKAPFQVQGRAVGSVIPHEGGLYEITAWREGKKVYLSRGGSVVQWEVWGRPVPEGSLGESVDEAVQKILEDRGGE